jgi:hypothetical protein
VACCALRCDCASGRQAQHAVLALAAGAPSSHLTGPWRQLTQFCWAAASQSMSDWGAACTKNVRLCWVHWLAWWERCSCGKGAGCGGWGIRVTLVLTATRRHQEQVACGTSSSSIYGGACYMLLVHPGWLVPPGVCTA